MDLFVFHHVSSRFFANRQKQQDEIVLNFLAFGSFYS